MKIEAIKKLCAEDFRIDLALPFKKGEYIYASNGKYCIRIKETPEFTTDVVSKVDISVLGWEMIDKVKNWILLMPIVQDEAFKNCRKCNGTGRAKICGKCSGEGEVECEYGFNHECPRCNGEGVCDNGKAESCEWCGGTGKVHDEEKKLLIGNNNVSAGQLYELQKVCGEILIGDVDYGIPVPLRFNGGDGLIMPCRK